MRVAHAGVQLITSINASAYTATATAPDKAPKNKKEPFSTAFKRRYEKWSGFSNPALPVRNRPVTNMTNQRTFLAAQSRGGLASAMADADASPVAVTPGSGGVRKL
ncbi:hypothetical protein ACERK3_11110 [Phycisphaerales bacterium AB-hyl4]|uniref:Uncharacterized protein n=1 Tax=Natronomicrosphaera hydrolytica TaxID=3242702 RepID=A0ABV4U7M7_9BACT